MQTKYRFPCLSARKKNLKSAHSFIGEGVMQWSSTGNWKDTYMILKFLAGVRADDMEWVT